MEFNQDEANFGGDFQKLSDSKLIVNLQGPFYQRGCGPGVPYQQKSSSTPITRRISTADHDDMQVNTVAIKAVQRSNITAVEGTKISFESSSHNRLELPIAIQLVQNSSKQFADEAEEEEDEDDCNTDPAINVCSSEQTGRWTRKEHEVFLEALKKFGKVFRCFQ